MLVNRGPVGINKNEVRKYIIYLDMKSYLHCRKTYHQYYINKYRKRNRQDEALISLQHLKNIYKIHNKRLTKSMQNIIKKYSFQIKQQCEYLIEIHEDMAQKW